MKKHTIPMTYGPKVKKRVKGYARDAYQYRDELGRVTFSDGFQIGLWKYCWKLKIARERGHTVCYRLLKYDPRGKCIRTEKLGIKDSDFPRFMEMLMEVAA